MHHEGDGHAYTVLLALILGTALGAGLGLLLAPQSGRRTRRQIAEMAEDLRDYATDVGKNIKSKVT